MEINRCHFIPYHKEAHSLHTIHFVLETTPQSAATLRTESVYKMYYVRTGRGKLHTPGRVDSLQAGDIFFTFPAHPFAIESDADFTFLYISFVGTRGNMLMENLGISGQHFLFHDTEAVAAFWERGVQADEKVIGLMSEAVLLYTFAFLGSRLLPDEKETRQQHSAERIKKYVDDHLSDPDFSLETMSQQLSYNRKYISAVFKKHMGVGVSEYVNTVRIQNACTFLRQGYTCVGDIAWRCGFSDAQYFSRVFRAKMGVTPTQFMRQL